jgi:hypothetical protein
MLETLHGLDERAVGELSGRRRWGIRRQVAECDQLRPERGRRRRRFARMQSRDVGNFRQISADRESAIGCQSHEQALKERERRPEGVDLALRIRAAGDIEHGRLQIDGFARRVEAEAQALWIDTAVVGVPQKAQQRQSIWE